MKRKFSVLLLICFFTLNMQAQRNVILIIADDLGTDYFGFNEDHVDTVDVPNIRKLLSKGVRFKNLMSNPVCSSTRTTILTGRYSFRTGVGGIVGGTGGSNQIDTSEMTIPKLLKMFNPAIAKADIGKWHLNQPNPAINLQAPLILGYDHFEGPFIGQLPSYTNWTKYTNGISSTVTNYATTENVNNAVSWLKSISPSNPFFLWLAFNAPHEPLHLPPAGLHSYTSLNGTPANINAQPKEYFKAMTQAMDHEMGRLFDSLQAMNKLDSTDIIFIGDNGNTQRTAQIANLDKAKGTVYQYGVHVPMIISGPSVSNPGRSSEILVNTTDIFATILELMGHTSWSNQIPLNKPVDSKSIMPIIKNQNTTIRPWSFAEIFKITSDSSDGKAMRNMDYKLIKFDYGAEEFYNLALDPSENTNLLTTTLTSTDNTNYYYLCNEMNTLLGNTNYCKNGVGVKDISATQLKIYPNPFTKNIQVNGADQHDLFQLYNSLGQLIYEGTQVTHQDFSHIPAGLYFLKVNQTQVFKMRKE